MLRLSRTALGLVACALFLGAPARAAEADLYLPDDTEVVVSFNVKQLVDSPLVKKYLLEELKKAIKSNDEAAKVLKDLNLDPLKDFDRITVAAGANPEKGLIIVRGKFDRAKIQDKLAALAKDDNAKLKIIKEGDTNVYEVDAGQQKVYAAIIDGSTIVAAPARDLIKAALTRSSGAKKPALKKELVNYLAKADAKQTMYLVALTSGVTGKLPPGVPLDDNTKKLLDNVEALTGNISVDKGVKLEFTLSLKDADSAKALNALIDEGLNTVKGIAPLITAQKKELAPVAKLIEALKTAAKQKTVEITGEVTGDEIEKALKD